MLRVRIFTAAVLLFVIALAVMAPTPWPMMVLLALMCGCAWWEWLRLVLPHAPHAAQAGALAVLLLVAAAIPLQQIPIEALGAWRVVILVGAVLFWLLLAPASVLCARLPSFLSPWILSVLGAWVLGATWLALGSIFLYQGAAALISLWALIWCADIAAYFVGRAVGRHKLAPRVSPGKSWEGALGGVLAAVLWLLGTALWWPGSFGALLASHLAGVWLVVVGAVLGAWSIFGDLFESLLKRRAGVKDSSQLLPGHGGVYDRIDAVLPVAPAALLLLLFL
ncbi:MAG TPA: phosphatidate cytidylyltransferase [Castellaniella sp.]|uniref:phosphatidate cytidylyltransferase n=1 Tax=Castellaniella sp. TaxID=1955812 RepID=UPI002EFEF95E